MVVTGDRDAYQLVDDGGAGDDDRRAGSPTRSVYDREGVIERYGIPPELIPDFIGLKGDTSDNIPGVPGIGDKTAAQLLQQFGSLEEVLAHVDEISGAKRKQNLREHADDARDLASSSRRCSATSTVGVDVGAEAAREPDRSRLREMFREFELRDPLRRLEEALGEPRRRRRAGARAATVRRRACARASPPDVGAPAATARSPLRRARRPTMRRGRAVRRASTPWRFAAYAGGAERRSSARPTARPTWSPRLGDRPVVAHDAEGAAAPCRATSRTTR